MSGQGGEPSTAARARRPKSASRETAAFPEAPGVGIARDHGAVNGALLGVRGASASTSWRSDGRLYQRAGSDACGTPLNRPAGKSHSQPREEKPR